MVGELIGTLLLFIVAVCFILSIWTILENTDINMKSSSVLALLVLVALILLIGISLGSRAQAETLDEALDRLPQIEYEVCDETELYPRSLTYDIITVNTVEEVREIWRELYDEKNTGDAKRDIVIAFYDIPGDFIVIHRGASVDILKHEIAHAVVDHYFLMPVPSYLHEIVAERGEVSECISP